MTGSSRPQVVTTDNANFQAMLTAADLANQIAVNGLLAVDGANQVIGTVPDLVKAQTTAALIPLNSAVAGALASQVTSPDFISPDATYPRNPTVQELSANTNVFGSRLLPSGARQSILWNRNPGVVAWQDTGQPGATKADTDAAAVPGQKALAVVSYANVAALLADTALSASQPALADGSRWSSTALADDGGTVMTAQAGRVKREGLSFVAPEMFPVLWAQADKAPAINAAQRNSQGKPVLLTGSYTIRSTVTNPVTASLTAVGTAVLNADFANWTGAENVALDILTTDRTYYAGADRNTQVNGLRIVGSGNSDRLSRAVRIRSPLAAVNINFISQVAAVGKNIFNLHVIGFDTAYTVNELWQSGCDNWRAEACRVGLEIGGQVVNVNWKGLHLTAPSKANTSSTAQTYGVTISGANRYSADWVTAGTLYARPEGLTFDGPVVFGFDTNVLVLDILSLNMQKVVLDGAVGDSLDIQGGDFLHFDGFVYTTATRATAPTRGWSPVVVRNNTTPVRSLTLDVDSFADPSHNSKIAVYLEDSAGRANGITVSVKGDGFDKLVSVGVIKGVAVKNIEGAPLVAGVEFRGGDVRGSLVDDVRISGNVPPLTLGGGLTGLTIGNCTSSNSRTQAAGVVTMNSGATSANITTGAYASETGWRMLTLLSPAGNLGSVWVDVDTAGSNNPIAKCSAAPASNTKVYWTSQAVPLADF